MSMKRLANPQLINGMPLLILLAMPAITYAAAAADVATAAEDYEDTSDNQVTVDHWGDAAVATITAWNVMVIVSLLVFSLVIVMCLLL